MSVIFLRLQAPLMSFGTTSVDELHSTQRFPAISMITGLLANALGVERSEYGKLERLQSKIKIASRIDREGTLLREYQTVDISDDPQGNRVWGKNSVWSSDGKVVERKAGKNTLTVQLCKEFWCDRSVLTAVEASQSLLNIFQRALLSPARPLFLGRACCAPATAIFTGTSDNNLLDALKTFGSLDNRNSDVQAQWPFDNGLMENHETVRVQDIKDWRTGLHTGERLVSQGILGLIK